MGHQIRLDDIDIAIMEILNKNPRESLRTISSDLKKKGLKITPESIRKRIKHLGALIEFETFPKFKLFGFDIVIVLITVSGGRNARKKVITKLHKENGFSIAETIGPYDITACFAVKKNSDLAKIINIIKEMPEVKNICHLIITKTHTSIHNFLNQFKNTSKK